MSFDICQLRYAIAAADHGSFYRAARALDVEQSTLSRNILQLERSSPSRRPSLRRPARRVARSISWCISPRRGRSWPDAAMARCEAANAPPPRKRLSRSRLRSAASGSLVTGGASTMSAMVGLVQHDGAPGAVHVPVFCGFGHQTLTVPLARSKIAL